MSRWLCHSILLARHKSDYRLEFPISMRGATLAGLLVVAILAGAGGGYLVGNAGERVVIGTLTTTVSEQAPIFSYITTAFGCTLNVRSYTPCMGSPAYVFNSCQNEPVPAAPSTCSYTLKPPSRSYPTYSFNITLGVMGQSGEPEWANCSVSGGIGYADCIPIINSTAFIVAVPAPPPQ